MNESFFEKLHTLNSRAGAGEERLARVRERLVHFIEAEAAVREVLSARHIPERSIMKGHVVRFRFMAAIATFMLVVLLGGGTSFAAQNALPGELLYPVKVDFNEKVGSVFHLSAEGKTGYEVALANERLKEASVLSAKGELGAGARQELEARFEGHATQAREGIKEMGDRGEFAAAASVASDFETSLTLNSKILGAAEEKDKDVYELRVRVDDALRAATDAREELETEVASSGGEAGGQGSAEVRVSAVGKVGAAENVIASVRSYLEKKKRRLGSADAEAAAEAEARLALADSRVVEAKAKLEAGAVGEAFNLGNEAIRIAQEARGLMEAHADLNLDVSINGPERDSSSDDGANGEGRDQERERSSSSSDATVEQGSNGGGNDGQIRSAASSSDSSEGEHGEGSDDEDTRLDLKVKI